MFGVIAILLFERSLQKDVIEVYNNLDWNSMNLFLCVKERSMAFCKRWPELLVNAYLFCEKNIPRDNTNNIMSTAWDIVSLIDNFEMRLLQQINYATHKIRHRDKSHFIVTHDYNGSQSIKLAFE